MTLQRRVTLFLLLSAPLVWAAGLLYGFRVAQFEINELFDTQQVRLARVVLSTLPAMSPGTSATPRPPTPKEAAGAADLVDLSIAVWDRQGRLLLSHSEGVLLPQRGDGDVDGFVDLSIDAQVWRVYYQRAAQDGWLVGVGQPAEERAELVMDILMGQMLPWVLMLPVLLLAMGAAVRQALKPVRSLTDELLRRKPDELTPLPQSGIPSDLLPLVLGMNALLARIASQVEHERRFTADAAHELRTPLAALQAQWDAARLQAGQDGRPPSASDAKISAGLARLSRLVTQMLVLARLEHLDALAQQAPIDWHTLVEQVFSELLPLAEARQVELGCEWPPRGAAPLLQSGDNALIGTLLRNLLDNAVRHCAAQARVTLRLGTQSIEVVDEGPGVPLAQRGRLGDRFFRQPGQAASGSGLGLSIARRIATLHGLVLSWHDGGGGGAQPGFIARLSQG